MAVWVVMPAIKASVPAGIILALKPAAGSRVGRLTCRGSDCGPCRHRQLPQLPGQRPSLRLGSQVSIDADEENRGSDCPRAERPTRPCVPRR